MKISDNDKEELLTRRIVPARRSWQNPQTHFISTLSDPWYQVITFLNNNITYSANDFFKQKNFLASLMPITCSSISSPIGLGSDSIPVSVNLFGEDTYLADSMQFQLEYILRICYPTYKGSWYIMPTFRGENHDERHLNQFFHLEAELVGNLEDVMLCIEQLVKYLSQSILKSFESQIMAIAGHIDHITRLIEYVKIPQITFKQAREILKGQDAFISILPGIQSITCKGEIELINYFNGPVWLTHLPRKLCPFYQDHKNDIAFCADLLMGRGEVVGSGQRLVHGQDITQSLLDHQVDPREYTGYITMKEKYPLATSGFGLGIERFLLWILAQNDIRDIQIIPRLKGIRAEL
jgi:aspartyl/asparaginyl-tRNA synthetase